MARKQTNPQIEITPSRAEYEQLCRDLAILRKAGAASNTAAIVKAIHVAALGDNVVASDDKRGSVHRRPRPSNRRRGPDAKRT